MLPESLRWVVEGFEPDGDPWLLLAVARDLEKDGNLEGAAAALDRAYGIDPALGRVSEARNRVLEALAVVERGLTFRYVPEGPFLMGSRDGEPDERPLRPVWLRPFWIADVPMSWERHCALMGWTDPPDGLPGDPEAYSIWGCNKIRLQYCEDETTRAVDWHAHSPDSPPDVFGTPPREHADAPMGYVTKPMVAVGWHEAIDLAERLSTPSARYSLPSEAQWEKAARGGLVGSRYPWGDDPPTDGRCDFGRFDDFSIRPSRAFAPNGYGLHAMAGGVWEWCADWYDAEAYRHGVDHDPAGPDKGEERVVRGGSWADCADVLRVSFRMSLRVTNRINEPSAFPTPTVGYRLCRVATGHRTSSVESG